MTVSADYQVEIRDLLIGVPGESGLTGPIGGLLSIGAKPNDVDLGHADGTYQGPAYRAARALTVPMWFDALLIDDFLAGWDVSSTDLELHMQLPFWGHIYVVGRPVGLVQGDMDLDAGTITALGMFTAGNPTIHTVSEGSS